MTIRRSDIIGKAINELDKSITDYLSLLSPTNTPQVVWSKLSTKAINLLSRCTLKYSKSYGATYKIDPTSELTIIHTDGTKYTVDSYKKLLTMVIADYDEPTGATMPTNIRDYRINTASITRNERKELYKILTKCNEPVSDDVLHTNFTWKFIKFFKSSYVWDNSDEEGNSSIEISFEGFIKLFNKPQEQPMPTQPQPGTHWERLEYLADHSPKSEIVTVEEVTTNYVSFSDGRALSVKEFLKRFKPRPDLDTPASKPTQRRKLAFYKESGKPWTYDEYMTMSKYCGDRPSGRQLYRFSMPNPHKYVYDDGDTSDFMYDWNSKNPEKHPEDYTILSYESVFEPPAVKPITKQTSTKTTKPKPVAQPEPIIPTPTKETFMSKIKASASATVDQNKQALVIASKMEAGRIINKQVLKQLTPHLPFFLQGYAKSPFAPFVAANLVAMVANHTGNSKLTKVSDLMLLGAADSGVTAFNLDKIVDDILSNIKLPAGVLDDSDDE